MPWIRRRRYDPYYDPYYSSRRQRGGYGPSCLRDACLIETGCCIGESLDGNCLMLTMPLLPRLFTAISLSVLGTRSPSVPGTPPMRRSRRGAGALLAAIRIYQRDISANRPACCRFTPSCSEYAAQAIDQRGALPGMVLAARRLLRCRPGGARGADPLPA